MWIRSSSQAAISAVLHVASHMPFKTGGHPDRRARPPASRARLEEFRDVFAFVEQEVPIVVDRFLRDRAGTTGRKERA